MSASRDADARARFDPFIADARRALAAVERELGPGEAMRRVMVLAVAAGALATRTHWPNRGGPVTVEAMAVVFARSMQLEHDRLRRTHCAEAGHA